MDVSLPPELERLIQAQIGSGHYQNPVEVIRAGLTRLGKDPTPSLPELPATIEELEAQLLESIQRYERGEFIDGEESLRQMRKWMADATASHG